MICFETLNPIIETRAVFYHGDELEDEGNIFEVQASFEESSRTLVTK
jgi:hypothetical protein